MLINIVAKVYGKNLFSLIDILLVINILSLHYFIYCALLAFQHYVKFIECDVYCHIGIFDSDVKVTNIAKKPVVSLRLGLTIYLRKM